MVKLFSFCNILMIIYGCSSHTFDMYEKKVRKIVPPRLEPENLGTVLYCYRPNRRHGPNMDIEEKHQKIIAHNYGHESFGWSLGPGSADYIVGLLTSQEKKWGLHKEQIAIILRYARDFFYRES